MTHAHGPAFLCCGVGDIAAKNKEQRELFRPQQAKGGGKDDVRFVRTDLRPKATFFLHSALFMPTGEHRTAHYNALHERSISGLTAQSASFVGCRGTGRGQQELHIHELVGTMDMASFFWVTTTKCVRGTA